MFCFISYIYVLCRYITIAFKNRITHVNDQEKAAYITVPVSSTFSLFIMPGNSCICMIYPLTCYVVIYMIFFQYTTMHFSIHKKCISYVCMIQKNGKYIFGCCLACVDCKCNFVWLVAAIPANSFKTNDWFTYNTIFPLK